MSRNTRPRKRGEHSADEALKGKNRELQKYIRQLENRVRELEKLMGMKSTLPALEDKTVVKPEPKKIVCDSCGKGEMVPSPISKPGGTLMFLVCELCKERKRV